MMKYYKLEKETPVLALIRNKKEKVIQNLSVGKIKWY